MSFIKNKIRYPLERLRPEHHHRGLNRLIRWLSILTIYCLFGFAGFLFFIIFIFNLTLPSVHELANVNLQESTIIYDREGNQLYAIHGDENRVAIELETMSPYLIDATIATEDDDFYKHWGFDVKSLSRAFINNVLGKQVSGASTITQQFIKNTFLTPEKSYVRKIKELILAVKLEIFFSKNEILEMYLNEIPYGNNAYGSQLAAYTYFDKEASELTLAESAILAAIPNAPTYYSPYGNHKYSTIDVEFTEEDLQKRKIKAEDDLDFSEYSIGRINGIAKIHNG